MDAFISHSSSNAKLATRIERVLEEDGLKVWLDRSEIRPGRLLRGELQAAVKRSRVVVLVWSKDAARSRWVAAEVLTGFHLGRFVIACASDKTALPYFLQKTIYLDVQPRKTGWIEDLRRAVRKAPRAPNELLPGIGHETPELQERVQLLNDGQMAVLERIAGNNLDDAKKWQKVVDRGMRAARKKWRLEAQILNLAGYHCKNAYMLKHWAAIMAGQPPGDRLLEQAERCFYDALFVNPCDYSALNGLGSILFYERELDAAEFFIRRGLFLAEKDGVNYLPAQHDLQLVLAFKRRNTGTPAARSASSARA